MRIAAQPVRMASGRRSKYRAVPVMVDGVRFASTAESRYYGFLQLRLKAGEIRYLVLQPVYHLFVRPMVATGVKELIQVGKYVGDFRFEEFIDGRWQTVVVDVKGVRTPLYKLKKKIVEALYGIEVQEVR